MCQSSSLEFLTRYGFDFNKFIYGGISYLNDSQESELSEDLRNGALFRAVDRNIPFQDEDRIRDICCDLAKWVAGNLQQKVSGFSKRYRASRGSIFESRRGSGRVGQ